MITMEDGPGDVFSKLQAKGKPFSCFECMSVLVALPLSFLTPNFLLYWLAIVAVAKIVNLQVEGRDGVQ